MMTIIGRTVSLMKGYRLFFAAASLCIGGCPVLRARSMHSREAGGGGRVRPSGRKIMSPTKCTTQIIDPGDSLNTLELMKTRSYSSRSAIRMFPGSKMRASTEGRGRHCSPSDTNATTAVQRSLSARSSSRNRTNRLEDNIEAGACQLPLVIIPPPQIPNISNVP